MSLVHITAALQIFVMVGSSCLLSQNKVLTTVAILNEAMYRPLLNWQAWNQLTAAAVARSQQGNASMDGVIGKAL